MNNNTPNKGIGDWLLVAYISLIGGFFKFGFDWYGLKALLFAWLAVVGYTATLWIALEIIDYFKEK